MVEHPAQYRWSSYRVNAQGEDDTLIRPHAAARQAAYRALFRQALEPGLLDAIRHATHGNYALGDRRFTEQIASPLQRVEVQIVQVVGEVGVVADQVLPVAPLPDTALAAPLPRQATPLASGHPFGKRHLDQPPAQREIAIARRQRQHAMQMIRQHHPAVDHEGMGAPYRAHRLAQGGDVANQQVVATPLQQGHGKEVGAARHPGTAVVGHGISPQTDTGIVDGDASLCQ